MVLLESGRSSTANQQKHDQGPEATKSTSKTGSCSLHIHRSHSKKNTFISGRLLVISEAASRIKESTSWRPFKACQRGRIWDSTAKSNILMVPSWYGYSSVICFNHPNLLTGFCLHQSARNYGDVPLLRYTTGGFRWWTFGIYMVSTPLKAKISGTGHGNIQGQNPERLRVQPVRSLANFGDLSPTHRCVPK